jgi:hypothetical protein
MDLCKTGTETGIEFCNFIIQIGTKNKKEASPPGLPIGPENQKE